MSPDSLHRLFEDVAAGRLTAADAAEKLACLATEDLGHTLVDHHRSLRQGLPEIIYGAGKSGPQIVDIFTSLRRQSGRAMATRVVPDAAATVLQAHPDAAYHEESGLLWLGEFPGRGRSDGPLAVVACAGTSDLAVAGEAALTLEWLGHRVERLTDIGVAGLHRLLARLETLRAADVIVCVAGMEGALPSVVGGLVACPVIAVPTSVGYGVADRGRAALHAMLTSCASGLAVVNIDNGHGAAILAHRFLARLSRPSAP